MFLDILGWIYCLGLLIATLMYFRAEIAKSYETLWYAIHYVIPVALGLQALKGFLAIFIADWFTVGTSVFCLSLGYLMYNMYKYRTLPRFLQYKKVTAKEKADAEAAKIIEELHQTYKI